MKTILSFYCALLFLSLGLSVWGVLDGSSPRLAHDDYDRGTNPEQFTLPLSDAPRSSQDLRRDSFDVLELESFQVDVAVKPTSEVIRMCPDIQDLVRGAVLTMPKKMDPTCLDALVKMCDHDSNYIMELEMHETKSFGQTQWQNVITMLSGKCAIDTVRLLGSSREACSSSQFVQWIALALRSFPIKTVYVVRAIMALQQWQVLVENFPQDLLTLSIYLSLLDEQICQALGSHFPESIQTLTLQSNNMKEECLRYIFHGTRENLYYLDLTGNRITSTGILALSESMPPNLLSLELGNNLICDLGASHLANSLPPYLENLNIAHNTISNIGALVLGRKLPNAFREMCVCGNRLTEDALFYLRERVPNILC